MSPPPKIPRNSMSALQRRRGLKRSPVSPRGQAMTWECAVQAVAPSGSGEVGEIRSPTTSYATTTRQ